MIDITLAGGMFKGIAQIVHIPHDSKMTYFPAVLLEIYEYFAKCENHIMFIKLKAMRFYSFLVLPSRLSHGCDIGWEASSSKRYQRCATVQTDVICYDFHSHSSSMFDEVSKTVIKH